MPYRDEELTCPACAERMAVANVESAPGGSVLVCRRCGGTWTDVVASQMIASSALPELEEIDDVLATQATGSGPPPAAPRACPVCLDSLARVVVARTELDACARHGTFFDRAELGRVIRILERKRRLTDPKWSSGDDMRWVSGTTSLQTVLSEEERAARPTIALREEGPSGGEQILAMTEKVLTHLWSVVTGKKIALSGEIPPGHRHTRQNR